MTTPKTPAETVLEALAALIGKCPANCQPSEAVLQSFIMLNRDISKLGDYDALKERADALERRIANLETAGKLRTAFARATGDDEDAAPIGRKLG